MNETPPARSVMPRRPDASMTLLREIMERPRDAAYEEAARTRSQGGGQRSWWQEFIVLVLTIAIGTGGIWAARQLRAPVDSALQARTVLEEQIRERSLITDSLREEISGLHSEISALEGRVSTPEYEERAAAAEVAAIRAGTVAVAGPGIQVTLTEPAQPGSDEEHVLDVDLQVVVNALWASGAEAIGINERRLSFGTAIRTAGQVILVDLEPVQSPYTISAVGDPDRLSRAFAGTSGAEHLLLINSTYRIKSTMTQVAHMELPAGNTLILSHAEPMPAEQDNGEEGDTE